MCARVTLCPSPPPLSLSLSLSLSLFLWGRWRQANKVDKMVLCGHSLGGYLSVCYAEKYPQRIDKLVLASPVRFPHLL